MLTDDELDAIADAALPRRDGEVLTMPQRVRRRALVRAGMREAAKIAETERLAEPTREADDIAYEYAITCAARAIRAAAGEGEG